MSNIFNSYAAKRWRVKANYQWQIFNLAVMFFTRLPVGHNIPYSEKRMNAANRYFSLVGLCIGAIVALIFWLASQFFPTTIAVALAMIVSVFITGAFHEDGLADMADGIGGGLTQEKRLAIMKDCRLGTYGTITLVLTLMLKFLLLVQLSQLHEIVAAIVVVYGLSRAMATSLIFDTGYVSDIDTSKSKPLATVQNKADLLWLFAIPLIPICFWFYQLLNPVMLLIKCGVVLFVFRLLFRRWIIARIGGFTGDCLGGAQQVSELLLYLVLVSHLYVVNPAGVISL